MAIGQHALNRIARRANQQRNAEDAQAHARQERGAHADSRVFGERHIATHRRPQAPPGEDVHQHAAQDHLRHAGTQRPDHAADGPPSAHAQACQQAQRQADKQCGGRRDHGDLDRRRRAAHHFVGHRLAGRHRNAEIAGRCGAQPFHVLRRPRPIEPELRDQFGARFHGGIRTQHHLLEAPGQQTQAGENEDRHAHKGQRGNPQAQGEVEDDSHLSAL
ncbi:hypothetical protein D3C85_1185780 [compost metagenome]